MGIKVLLDTNIVLDLFDNERSSSEKSLTKVKALLQHGDTLYVNSDTLTTAFYILRNQKKASFEESLYAIQETMNICELISIEIGDVNAALELCTNEECSDYEDALQYVCAKKIDAELIVTNDKRFVSLDVEICSTMS